MTQIREILPGVIELSTDKYLDELEKSGDVIAIYEKENEKAKVLIDMSEFTDEDVKYIY